MAWQLAQEYLDLPENAIKNSWLQEPQRSANPCFGIPRAWNFSITSPTTGETYFYHPRSTNNLIHDIAWR